MGGELYHVVPWYNTAEWQHVYNVISDPSSKKENAIKILLIWKARSPSLPTAVESTLGLLQVYEQDNKQTDLSEFNDQLLRLAYSSAIMRFVNHVLDNQTEKGSSLYRAAKNLGVPDWVIDLRHEAAHSNTLPPLSRLREACAIGLQWLQKNYWNIQKQCIEDYISEMNGYGDYFSTVINVFVILGTCAQSKVKNVSEIPNPSLKNTIVSECKELLGDSIDLSDLRTVSINSISNSLNKNSNKFLRGKESRSLLIKTLLGDDSQLLSIDLVLCLSASDFKYKKKLYATYVQGFEILLKFLHKNDLLLDLVMGLIKVTQDDNRGCQTGLLAALWLSEIIGALKKCKIFQKKIRKSISSGDSPKKMKELKKKYNQLFGETPGHLMLDVLKPVPAELHDIKFIQPFITTYNPYLSYFVEDLLDLLNPQLPKTVVNKVCMLAKVISSPEKLPMSSSATIHTADDFKMSVDGMVIDDSEDETPIDENVQENKEQKTSGIWRLASRAYEWSTCPIGEVPWHQQQHIEKQSNFG